MDIYGDTLRKEQIKVSENTHIDVLLLKDGSRYSVVAMEWTLSDRGTGAGAEKLRQNFDDRKSANAYFDDVIEKWS